MPKEGLVKEAEEWLDDERKYIIEDDEGFLINISKKVKEAYLAGAEPREKRIADLEAQIEKMKCCTNCKHSRTVYEHCKTNKHEKWEMKENDRRITKEGRGFHY